MIERIQTYFDTLKGLSTDELDRSMEKLVREEKRNVALVIMHIAEMSRRKGHLERGYKNLFDYCTRRLHLSEGSVALRIQVANVSRRFPCQEKARAAPRKEGEKHRQFTTEISSRQDFAPKPLPFFTGSRTSAGTGGLPV